MNGIVSYRSYFLFHLSSTSMWLTKVNAVGNYKRGYTRYANH